MKKIISALLITLMLTATSCSTENKPTEQDPTAATTIGTVISEDASDKQTPSINILTFEDDHPDKLTIKEGGTAPMTLFRCGNAFYACIDGSKGWEKVSGPANVDLKDGAFLHVDATYKLQYGGIAGYKGQKLISQVSNEKTLSPDEIISRGSIAPYDPSEGRFQSPRLIEKNGKNYIICMDPLGKYRLYDDKGENIFTSETYMECAESVLNDGDRKISYSRSNNFPFWVVRIGDLYYAYSRFGENNNWKVLLDLNLQNKPIGFELEDGQAMKISSASFYIINGGDNNYVNVPMFEKMDHYSRSHYTDLNSDCSKDQWDNVTVYRDGKSYQYYADNTEYVIFFLEGRFHVYCGRSSSMETEKLLGVYNTAAEVNAALGI